MITVYVQWGRWSRKEISTSAYSRIGWRIFGDHTVGCRSRSWVKD
ncbi:hypothetical protein LINGRAHAP2_LOCUS36509 [Linum grandiflorum]